MTEASRTDPEPDAEALRLAEFYAHQACRLNPDLAEAWATLGVVLERAGRRGDALAALECAVTLEPDNWRHQVRLALGSWGETRLRAARRALAQCPQLPQATGWRPPCSWRAGRWTRRSGMWTARWPWRRWSLQTTRRAP